MLLHRSTIPLHRYPATSYGDVSCHDAEEWIGTNISPGGFAYEAKSGAFQFGSYVSHEVKLSNFSEQIHSYI